MRSFRVHSAPLRLIPPRRPISAPRLLGASQCGQQVGISRQQSSKSASSSNPPLSFPCLDRLESRTAQLKSIRSSSGPEPSYVTGAHKSFHLSSPLHLDYGGVLPEYKLAYETWGELNADKSNAILLFTGLSASSHAKSNELNSAEGWWEKFIGPGKTLDTDKYFVICSNVLGGCYGSTGPSSTDPSDGLPYATRFPIVTMGDMVRAQFSLLDGLGIGKLFASVGASMGGMLSLASAKMFPERVGRLVTISACARSHPYSIALRHTQRQVLMADPAWNRGFYYDSIPPHTGMKLARQIATITYRSGPEWEQRFGRSRADPNRLPALCPDFLIETYLDHAGEKWCLNYDANSLLYVSKAMDLFDLGEAYSEDIKKFSRGEGENARCGLEIPDEPIQEVPRDEAFPIESISEDLVKGLRSARNIPALVLGVKSDILFPAWQQAEIAQTLIGTGNKRVEHIELGEDISHFGHDTFLLDVKNVGGSVARFLSKEF